MVTVREMRSSLKQRGLSTSGTKAQLAARLEQSGADPKLFLMSPSPARPSRSATPRRLARGRSRNSPSPDARGSSTTRSPSRGRRRSTRRKIETADVSESPSRDNSLLRPDDHGSEEHISTLAWEGLKTGSGDHHERVRAINYWDEQFVDNITFRALYKPHSISLLLVGLFFMYYAAFVIEGDHTTQSERVKFGAMAAVGVIITVGLLVFPNGPFTRPHPLVWRTVFSVSFAYFLFLVVLLFQNADDARFIIHNLDSDAGIELEERAYGDSCELTAENVKDVLFDRFVLAHLIGWILKAMMIRDMMISWWISLTWELLEIAFAHMLPNFLECWWDQWIIDVMLCNGLGIYIGHKMAVHFEMKIYRWSGILSYETLTAKLQRAAMQFTPSSWTEVHWEATKSVKRFLQAHAMVLFVHLSELNAFFMKTVLWIPPESNLNIYRMLIWYFIGLVSFRQMYIFIADPSCKRLGTQAWMTWGIMLTEVLIIYKFSHGQFPNEMPDNIRLGTTAFVVLYLCLSFVLLRRRRLEDKRKSI